MNGRDLTLGIAAGLAVAGVVAKKRRGSPALTSLTAPQGLSPASPWRGIVGAAKGGPARQAYTEAFARFPLDLSIEIVGSQKQAEAWLQKVQRPGPGKLRACLWARDTEERNSAAAAIQKMRKQRPSEAFALYSPFTVAHRLFDASTSSMISDPSHKLPLSAALWNEVTEGGDGTEEGTAAEALREWAFDGCDAAQAIDIEEDEEGYDAAMDACAEASFAQWASIRTTYQDAQNLLTPSPHYLEKGTKDLRPLLEKGEDSNYGLPSRVLVSLVCPTAAGRLLRLTDYGQAMADCYATWTVSGRNPLVRLTERDLTHFSVDAQIQRWLATASAKKATEGQIQKYRRELERVAVPVLRTIRENEPDMVRRAVRLGEDLHGARAGLIEAANQMYALQRIVVL
jgi:hypothetical protein